MLTKIMKWASIALLLPALFWRSSASYHLVLELVVCMGALLVVVQAVRAHKYFWATGFLAIALLFNPVVPIGASRSTFLLVGLAIARDVRHLVGGLEKPTDALYPFDHRSDAGKRVTIEA